MLKSSLLSKNTSEPADVAEAKSFENDFDLSISVLTQSFITWNRLQEQSVVRYRTVEDVRHHEKWKDKYVNRFVLMHKGSSCQESIVIGSGKYCKVYKRYQFAYKYVKIGYDREDVESKSVLKCNLKELCYFHSMCHPNVMRPMRSQIVMEHGKIRRLIHEMPLARCTLLQMIEAHEISSFDDVVSVMTGVAKGLGYMNSHNIVHGDVKPGNILIMKDYTPVVSDFTLTTFSGRGKEISFGTLYWRAPECLACHSCDTPADVWGFGVMLLDCLYGCIYFKDVLTATDNTGMMVQIAGMIGQPPTGWCERFRVDEDIFLQNTNIQDTTIRSSPLSVMGLDRDKINLVDLISLILKWNPEDRLEMKDVLKHPFFTKIIPKFEDAFECSAEDRFSKSISNNLQFAQRYEAGSNSSIILGNVVWNIQWRNDFERIHLCKSVVRYYNLFLNKGKGGSFDEKLLQDIVVVCKKVIERLRYLGTTFNIDNIVKWCTSFYCFVWEDIWTDNVEFESSLFHILKLVDYVGFPLIVKERKLGDEKNKRVDREHTQNSFSNGSDSTTHSTSVFTIEKGIKSL
jgi:serine/threonine protein kinase